MEDQQPIQVIEPSNPLAVMSLFDSDAKTLDTFIDYVCNTIESGMDDPLKVLAMSKKMQYVTKRIDEKIKEAAKREAEKHGDKSFTIFGCEMRQEATSTKYDYSACNDPKWNEASKIVEEREKLLKAITSPLHITIEDTGEMVTVYPPKKIQTFGLKTTVK